MRPRSVLVALAAIFLFQGNVQAATLQQATVVAGGPTIEGNATNLPNIPIVYPGFEVELSGVGFLSTDTSSTQLDIDITAALFGPSVPIKITDPTQGDSLVLSGLRVDSGHSADTVSLLYSTGSGSSAGLFGPFFKVTLRDGNFFGADFSKTVFAADTFVKIEAVSVSAVPIPASLPMLLAGLGTVAVVRRRQWRSIGHP